MNRSSFFEKDNVIQGQKDLFAQYHTTKLIGKGISNVYEVQNDETEEIKAMKEIQIFTDYELQAFLNEIDLLQKIEENPHENIVKYYGYLLVQDPISEFRNGLILLEKGKTSLEKFIRKQKETSQLLSRDFVFTFVKNTLSAFIHLQTIGVAHRDIKPENILVFENEEKNFYFKICDMGVSLRTTQNSQTRTRSVIGTLAFFSPELFVSFKSHKSISTYNPYRSDFYSYGLCLLYLCTLEKFSGTQRLEKDILFFQEKIDEWKEESRQNYPFLKDIIDHSLIEKEFLRYDFLECQEIYQSLQFYVNILKRNLKRMSKKLKLLINFPQKLLKKKIWKNLINQGINRQDVQIQNSTTSLITQI